MQIVIDMDEELYKKIKKNCYIYEEEIESVAFSIIGGTVLPKGHKIIDADELYNSLKFPTQQFASAFKQMLDDAPTIIEADRSENE